jgi:hypothetical protein
MFQRVSWEESCAVFKRSRFVPVKIGDQSVVTLINLFHGSLCRSPVVPLIASMESNSEMTSNLSFTTRINISNGAVSLASVMSPVAIEEYENIRGCIQKFPDWVITKCTLTTMNTRWEAIKRVMAAKFTRLTDRIAIQLHLVAESRTICSFRSRRPVRKLLVTKKVNCPCELSTTPWRRIGGVEVWLHSFFDLGTRWR